MQIGWQAAVGSRQVSANLHDGLARVDRTAGDTWRRQRGGGYIVSAGRVGIGKQKADGMIDKDFARHEILRYFFFFFFFCNWRSFKSSSIIIILLDSMSAKKKCSNKVSMISQWKFCCWQLYLIYFIETYRFRDESFYSYYFWNLEILMNND